MVNRSAPGGTIVPQVTCGDVAQAIWPCAGVRLQRAPAGAGARWGRRPRAVAHRPGRRDPEACAPRAGRRTGGGRDAALFGARRGRATARRPRSATRGSCSPPAPTPTASASTASWTWPATAGASRSRWRTWCPRPGAPPARTSRASSPCSPGRASVTCRFRPSTSRRRWRSTSASFGGNIRGWSSARPSFDDAAGHLSGAWVAGWPPSREPGLLPSIWMDSMICDAGARGGLRWRGRGGVGPERPGCGGAVDRAVPRPGRERPRAAPGGSALNGAGEGRGPGDRTPGATGWHLARRPLARQGPARYRTGRGRGGRRRPQ